jgi:hypothetical protein
VVEFWDTTAGAGQSPQTMVADQSGNLRIAVSSLKTDLAVKIRGEAAGIPRTPTNLRIVR